MSSKKQKKVVHYPFFQQNPYSRLLVAALNDVGFEAFLAPTVHHTNPFKSLFWVRQYSIVHWHWLSSHYQGRNAPRFILRTIAFALCLIAIRLHGTIMVVTVHNLYPHEHKYPCLHRFAARLIGIIVDRIVVHSSPAALAIKPLYKQPRKTVVVEHIDYSSMIKGPKGDRLYYKRTLGFHLDKPIILFFGQIRPYKGVEWLIDSADLFEQSGIKVVIAGFPVDTCYKNHIKTLCKTHPNVQLRLEFIPDDELSDLLHAADVVVFPYTNALTSGAAHFALAHDVSIVAPPCIAFQELIDIGIAIPIRIQTNVGLFQAVQEALKVDHNAWVSRNREYLNRCGRVAVGRKLAEIYCRTNKCCQQTNIGLVSDGEN